MKNNLEINNFEGAYHSRSKENTKIVKMMRCKELSLKDMTHKILKKIDIITSQNQTVRDKKKCFKTRISIEE